LSNFSNRPVSSFEQLQSNVAYLFQYVLPMLLFTQGLDRLSLASLHGWRAFIMIGTLAVTIVAVFTRINCSTQMGRMRCALGVALLILLCSCGLYSMSGAGGIRGGGTIRYIAPIFVAVPLLFAVSFAVAKTRAAKTAVIASVACLLFAHSVEYPFLNAQERSQRTEEWATGQSAISWVIGHQREVVVGDYWTVYWLNFDTKRSVHGLPIYNVEDYLGFGSSLRQPVRAALLDRDRSHLTTWAQRVGLRGHVERVGDSLFGYIIDSPVDIASLDQIRAVGQQLPRVF
jgi:hypothetical protein